MKTTTVVQTHLKTSPVKLLMVAFLGLLLGTATAPAAPIPEAEPNNSPETATPISCGDVVSASVYPVGALLPISPLGDVDFYKITLTSGQSITADIDSDPPLDLIMEILDTDGMTPLAFNNNASLAPNVLDPFLTFTAPADGTYYIGVSGCCNFVGIHSQAGPYTLTVTCAAPPPPCEINCPPNITDCNDQGQCNRVVSYPDPTTTGDCGPVTCTPPSGSPFSLGTTTVTCTAGGASCTFTVTVNDCEPPTVTCPGNITQCNDLGKCSAVVSAVVTATDCCIDTLSCTRSDGLPTNDPYPVGTTTVTCTAVDCAGNTSSCTFAVTVTLCTNRCPLTQGHWKNHPDAWPFSSLTLGTKTYTMTELLAILKMAVGTGKKADASLILADQLIAAKLNLLNGSNPCPIESTIAAADALIGNRMIPIMTKITPGTAPDGPQMVALAAILDSYNNGQLTLGCTP